MQEYIEFFTNHWQLSLAWIAIAFMFVHGFTKDKLSGSQNVTTQQAILLINKEKAVVVDLRSNDDFKKGHIVDAKNITESQIEEGNFVEIEKYKNSPIILVCESGDRSASVSPKLAKAGFTQLNNLNIGMVGWVSENLPTAKS